MKNSPPLYKIFEAYWIRKFVSKLLGEKKKHKKQTRHPWSKQFEPLLRKNGTKSRTTSKYCNYNIPRSHQWNGTNREPAYVVVTSINFNIYFSGYEKRRICVELTCKVRKKTHISQTGKKCKSRVTCAQEDLTLTHPAVRTRESDKLYVKKLSKKLFLHHGKHQQQSQHNK